jgi:ribonuclease HI
MKRITLTVGATSVGRPGPGGWAYILRDGQHSLDRSGGSSDTTKVRMELQALLEGFKAIKEPCHVVSFSENQQLVDGLIYERKEWRHTQFWQLSRKSPHPLVDGDLWEALDPHAEEHFLQGQYVSRLSGDPDLKRCLELAEAQAVLHGAVPSWSSLIDMAA